MSGRREGKDGNEVAKELRSVAGNGSDRWVVADWQESE